MNTSEQKPYADSTLKKKYRNLGMSPNDLVDLTELVDGCAMFYEIIDTDHAWLAIDHAAPGRFTKQQFEDLISIGARDPESFYVVHTDSFFYSDGCDDRYFLIDKPILYPHNPDFTEEDEKAFQEYCESGKDIRDYRGRLPFDISASVFYTLDEAKANHDEYYYPKNLADYSMIGYYERTPQTKEMHRFLMKSLDIDEDCADALVFLFTDTIRDVRFGPSEAMQKCVEFVEESDAFRPKHYDPFCKLLMNMNNATRMPANNGFSPNELIKKAAASKTIPTLSIGPNMRQRIANGEIDPESDLISDQMSPEIKEMIRNAIDEAKAKIPTDQKVGRSAPCPCGSGKKYKNCCGK